MKSNIKSNLLKFFLIVFAILTFRSLLYEPFIIPSGSMKNTLLVGDYIFVSKYYYGYSRFSFPFSMPIINARPRAFYKQPKRGDVVVFRGKKDTSTNYIKRIIGLPGDTIQIKSGVVYINDQKLNRHHLLDRKFDDYKYPERLQFSKYTEITENGNCYFIIQKDLQNPVNNTQKYYVPEGHFFVMGDNRENSTDSRFLNSIGFVPAQNLVGRAERVLISFGRSEKQGLIPIRFERIWKNIKPSKCKNE